MSEAYKRIMARGEKRDTAFKIIELIANMLDEHGHRNCPVCEEEISRLEDHATDCILAQYIRKYYP